MINSNYFIKLSIIVKNKIEIKCLYLLKLTKTMLKNFVF